MTGGPRLAHGSRDLSPRENARETHVSKFDKSKLPSRHVSVGPERAPHRSYYYAMGLTEEEIGRPFVGIASAGTARGQREQVWERLAGAWKPAHLDTICTRETLLDGLPEVFPAMLAGGSFGRTVVRF